ncbi:NAD(P)/FAD-dependent oxidoreductase [Aurantiacibacter odishensis]|uniref:NAD(P)/FAD-dependent oxidoreductase n=1 Tax=Aurantiacibacter odishensis TaxID=1155476 RepID=UPI000E714287|nr:FAD-dependent monooxygenase [Aurantiacibacter odishensis]
MRLAAPLILGAGPAGCAAAIELARAGASPILLDRSETVGDPLCGGFMSWRSLAQLVTLGVDPRTLGGHAVDHLKLFTGGRAVQTPLPHAALGLSRHALDTALRKAAIEAGAKLEIDTIRAVVPGLAAGQSQDWHAETIFLASGKHDVRDQARPRTAGDPALGLRLRLPASLERKSLIGSAIELHLFRGGYAGIVLQEDGSANVCLALRKSALTAAGSDPRRLLEGVAERNEHFAACLGDDWHSAKIETIGAVPYGWIAQDTTQGLFRLGDQAAVIPSLAGEGMSIAVASGIMAARYWLQGGAEAAPAYQRAFAARAHPPVQLAKAARGLAERRLGHLVAPVVASLAPGLLTKLAERCRIDLARPEASPPACTKARPC